MIGLVDEILDTLTALDNALNVLRHNILDLVNFLTYTSDAVLRGVGFGHELTQGMREGGEGIRLVALTNLLLSESLVKLALHVNKVGKGYTTRDGRKGDGEEGHAVRNCFVGGGGDVVDEPVVVYVGELENLVLEQSLYDKLNRIGLTLVSSSAGILGRMRAATALAFDRRGA